jgi:DNA-binding NarL/FixJ family response regulator
MLAEGVKDETIARQLGVSVRTLSRITSTLLKNLQVETRFQAGMKIVQLGLPNTP